MNHKQDETPEQCKERKIDEALEHTFPASDPPAHSGTTGVGGQHRTNEKGRAKQDQKPPSGQPR